MEAPKKGEKKRSLGRDYHPLCLKCHKCKRQLTAGQHAEHDEKPYCTNCYMRDFGPRAKNLLLGPLTRLLLKKDLAVLRNAHHLDLLTTPDLQYLLYTVTHSKPL
ncbi:hypothetical protein cypCar_00033048 [Cyprinus carpio]|nr:hypothetical protein cypCar_00033048 [Cyprinus carpio]